MTGVGRNTVGYWYSVARASIGIRMSSVRFALGGEGCIVEIDEAILRKRKFHKGKKKKQIWLFGSVERKENDEIGKCLIIRVPNRKKETLIPIIEANIQKGTTIYSDEWGAYKCLNELGYKHQTVCHKYEFKNTETGVCTNLIEGCWSHFRRSLPPCGIKEKFIDDFIASFLLQREKDMLFPEFVRNVTNFKPTEAAFPHDYDDGEGDDEADVPQIEQEAVEIHEDDYDDP